MVLFNVILSYRYDSDAVAAQATLVLLQGSTAGSVAGEDGVIIMLLISIFLHAIAIHKSSGNLASLGIALPTFGLSTYGGFELGSLNVVALQNPLKLFIAITGKRCECTCCDKIRHIEKLVLMD